MDGRTTVSIRTISVGGRARLVVAAIATALLALPAPADASTALVSFPAAVDTYVDSANPGTSYGTSSTLYVDASPVKRTLLRFDVTGLHGRIVTRARLRLNAKTSAAVGGRIFSMTSTSWTEGVTWNTRPEIDGPLLGTLGSVTAGGFYEVDLGPVVSDDGAVAFAMDSTSSAAAAYQSFDSRGAPPRLILDVESGDEIADGLMQIVDSKRGSSDPTYYASNHRMVVTEAGRVLVVHGRHASGVQLAWRDPAGNWQTQSRGEAADGAIIAGTGTGDWPASIALARDSTGSERAWVAFARVNATGARSVYLRRLSGLDDPAGPSIGPLVVVDPAPLGAFKVDLQFESVPGGPPRGVMVWQRKASDTVYEAVTAWFTDLDGDTPEIQAPTVIDSRSSSKLQATLVDGGGMRIAARRSSGKLVLYRHELDAPLGSWIRGGDLYSVSGWPAAVALDSGELLVAAETDTTNHVVKVERYSPAGEAVRVDLQLTGYSAPAIASDGVDAWLVMVRQSDGFVVSRRLTSLSGWDSMDRVEIGPESSGYRYPNVVSRVDGRLRLIVRGPSGETTPSSSAVLAFQRAV